MIDFLMISTRPGKQKGTIEVYPKFIVKKSSDLLIRGGDFYAIWVEDIGLWSTDEHDALQIIDRELDRYAEENRGRFDGNVRVLHMWDAETRMIESWHRYCQKDMRDSFHTLDEKLIFSNTPTNKKDYASKRLSYPLEEGKIDAYDRLISTLYSPEERHKIEWAIGSVVTGDSKKLQKFIVLYGSAGTGKSTVLNIIAKLFDGYYSVFDAKALGSSGNAFALEAFKSNPLVAIQHDGDLSKIEDNTRLNSLISHEMMTVNEKFKSQYANRFKCFLFVGTNRPVKITDGRSGLIRRLIDVSPSGEKLDPKEYDQVTKQIDFELGAIAYHCKEVYLSDPGRYDDYIPTTMLGATNDFYNFIIDSYHIFKRDDGTTLKAAWEMYKTYCEEAKVNYPFSQKVFKEELRTYFREYKDRFSFEDGSRARSYYTGFRTDKFENPNPGNEEKSESNDAPVLKFDSTESILDGFCQDCPAQYGNDNGTPIMKWDKVSSTLADIDTTRLHYVRLPENHIVIDFDIPDENGNKSLERNLAEASKWPPTYAELSKSGSGIHLHYIYSGDPQKLSRIYSEHIEIKVFSGNSSLRRKLTKCNSHPIETITSGLPLKGEKMVNFETIRSENGLRTMIKRNLNKEVHNATKPSVDFIYKILEDAYNGGLQYDVTDMKSAVLSFAMGSTHQAENCLKTVAKMHFKSEEPSAAVANDDASLVFYDVEVFPNLFLVNWKIAGEGKQVMRMINPTSADISELMRFRLVGFNCRRYDNHILYARLMGYSNGELYRLSQRLINKDTRISQNAMFSEAYSVSYTDVYDFCSKKQSLKKWEIELGIHHQELGLPWDQPVPEHLWTRVAEYCDNDVIATEAVFNARQADFTTRKILAEIAGMTVNDTTNSLSTRIIFGKNRKPQEQFNYRFLGDTSGVTTRMTVTGDRILYKDFGDEYTVFDENGRPVFPGYKYDCGVSTYRGEEVGEGGYVYAEPGMYVDVALLDITSMHPSSAIAEELFGKVYTARFEELVEARKAIKHGEFDKARTILNGVLAKYLTDKNAAADLAQALKIVINSIYGLTSAKFDNPFRDNRNVDNIVAKRGALFMINLKHEVQKRGFTVAHIKTDSIKIPKATPEIIQFVMDYGKQYGYNFEHEATYDRMCLVNDAVYIARYATVEKCYNLYGKKYVEAQKDVCKENKKHPNAWTATGTQFQIPYVFKTLFSKENIEFEDMCETKAVNSALYLDMNEDLPDVTELEKDLERIRKKAKEFGVELDLSGNSGDAELDPMVKKISEGHSYHFVGKVGQFCPIKPGCGGGILLRETVNEKTNTKSYAAATGSKGFRWLESEMVRQLEKQDDIDRTYYNNMVNEAIAAISNYGDFEWFVSEPEPGTDAKWPPEDENPF